MDTPAKHGFARHLAFGVSLIGLIVSGGCGDSPTDLRDVDATLGTAEQTENRKPVPSISSPTGNATFAVGSVVSFAGSATDPEDGALPGTALEWKSNRDGALGTGSSVTRSNLTAGVHEIILTARDSKGLAGITAIKITVQGPLENRKPVPSISSPAPEASFAAGSTVTFAGSATDEEDGALTGTTLEWKSSRDGSLGTGSSVSRSNLSVGLHEIVLTAKDSKGLTGSTQIKITIQGAVENRKPVPSISSPAPESSFAVGSTVTFAGSATDPEDGALPGTALEWRSNRDGALGTGSSVTRSNLTAGVHEIILTVRDSKGLTGIAAIKITVQGPVENRKPVPSISSPAPESSFAAGSTVTFAGSATDEEDGALPGTALEWRSNRDGALGTGSSVTRSNLAAGVHEIILTARDSKGLTGIATIKITVQGPVENRKPVPSISSPAPESSFAAGSTVTFAGSATDPEDGALPGTALEWRSNRDGALGTGSSVTRSNLTAGVHEIILTVRDSKGLTGIAAIKITVQGPVENRKPVPSISSPAPESSFAAGAAVTFAGSATDEEDGALPGTALEWKSSRDGSLGSGSSVTRSNLSAGVHEITLTAKDSKGATGSKTVKITIQSEQRS